MMKKRIMIIGPKGSGKTTLANYINDESKEIRKRVDVIYGKCTIDVPSGYLENTWMYKNIIALSQNASKIVFLIKEEDCTGIYSEGFARLFRCPVIGVICTKNYESIHSEKCEKELKRIGILKPYFKIKNDDMAEMKKLKEYLLK